MMTFKISSKASWFWLIGSQPAIHLGLASGWGKCRRLICLLLGRSPVTKTVSCPLHSLSAVLPAL